MRDGPETPLARSPDVLRSLERAMAVARRRRQLRLVLAMLVSTLMGGFAVLLVMWLTA
jgi:hypothetical protein